MCQNITNFFPIVIIINISDSYYPVHIEPVRARATTSGFKYKNDPQVYICKKKTQFYI